jgi:inhibitor of cysteine peptidase
MRRTKLHFGVVVLILAALLMGACTGQEKPEGTLTVAELLEDPVYDREVKIYGELALLGELFCPCFELTSGEQTLLVWYDLMTENDGTIRPAVSVEGITNGDHVTVKGELKGEGGVYYSKGDFWAVEISKTDSTPAEDLEIRLAPIHEVRVNIAESYPPQVIVYVEGGLSDGCTTFHSLKTERNGDTINIEVTTQRPKGAVCAQVYGFFEKNVNLGSDFVSGETYTINVNDYNTSFEMQ